MAHGRLIRLLLLLLVLRLLIRLLLLLLLLLLVLGRHARALVLGAVRLVVLRRARCLGVAGFVLATETHVCCGV